MEQTVEKKLAYTQEAQLGMKELMRQEGLGD